MLTGSSNMSYPVIPDFKKGLSRGDRCVNTPGRRLDMVGSPSFCEAAKAASQKRYLMVMRALSERLHHHQTLVSKFGITDVYYLS